MGLTLCRMISYQITKNYATDFAREAHKVFWCVGAIWRRHGRIVKKAKVRKMEKITLTKEKETMLIPLYGKAMDYQQAESMLHDKKAAEIVEAMDYDFSRLKIQKKTNVMMCMRAAMLDEITEQKLAAGKTLVLHLGCGLDSRCLRAGQAAADWYDVDYPEVIAIRKNFFAETKTYHMIASSVTEAEWIESIPNTGFDSVLVLAEGLVMYLGESAVKTLIARLKTRFKTFTLVMDVYNTMAAKGAKNHPSLKQTGVKEFWGFDDPKLLETWGLGLKHRATHHFAEYHLERLTAFDRKLYTLISHIQVARNAHRVEIYKIGEG